MSNGQSQEQKQQGQSQDQSPQSNDRKPGQINPGDQAPEGTFGTGENVCRECHGSGRIGTGPCPNCNGTGVVIEEMGGG